jgi:hypothetical protein
MQRPEPDSEDSGTLIRFELRASIRAGLTSAIACLAVYPILRISVLQQYHTVNLDHYTGVLPLLKRLVTSEGLLSLWCVLPVFLRMIGL